MKRLWIGLFVVCLASTAARAGTVHKYSFTAEITDVAAGGSFISVGDEITGWVEIHQEYFPDDGMPSDENEAYFISPPGQGFIKWHVEVAGEDYTQDVLPLSGNFVDLVYAVNGATSTDDDSLSIQSTREKLTWYMGIFCEDEDGTAIGKESTYGKTGSVANEVPAIVQSDWDTVTFDFMLAKNGSNPALTFTAVAIPLPSAAWIGLALLGALGAIRRLRRR